MLIAKPTGRWMPVARVPAAGRSGSLRVRADHEAQVTSGENGRPARTRQSVPVFDYRYELRRGEEVVATGHLSRERPFEVGERTKIGHRPGVVRTIEPLLGERELRLVVQLWREDVDA